MDWTDELDGRMYGLGGFDCTGRMGWWMDG
jgi:hypothetical protein